MGKKNRRSSRKTHGAKDTTASAIKRNVDVRNNVPRFDVNSLPLNELGYLNWLSVLALALLVVLALFPATQAGFVWDDQAFTDALPIQSMSGLSTIWLSPSELPWEAHYWPITYITFWLEHKLWGYEPLAYHIFNLILHSANSCLVFYLLWRLAVPGAWLAAAVFAIHPVHVEPVVWVIGRKDLLSTMFCLCLFLVWIRFREQPEPVLWRYALALVLFITALFSKSTIVAVPVVLLIWQWWKGERVQVRHLLWILPFFVIGLVYSYLDYSFYISREKVDFDHSLLDRMMFATQAIWFYIIKLVWPTGLSIIYPKWEFGLSSVYSWLSLIGALGLAGVLWWFKDKTGKGYLAGLSFFVVFLMPVLGFIDYGYMQFAYAADRYQYLASVGVIGVACSLAVMGSGKLPSVFRTGTVVVAAVVLAAFGYLSWQQAKHYEDEISLFSHILTYNPVARGANANMSRALESLGEFERALDHGYTSIENHPKLKDGFAVTGNAHLSLGQFKEAEGVLRRGFELDPYDRSISGNLAESLRWQEKYEEALYFYRQSIKHNPNQIQAYVGIGDCLFNLKQYEEAITNFRQYLRLEKAPTVGITDFVHFRIGLAQTELEQFKDAEYHLRQANAILPNKELILQNLANALHRQDEFDEAIAVFEQVKELNPKRGLPYVRTAQILIDMNRNEQAQAELMRALEIDPEESWVSLAYIMLARIAKESNDSKAEIENYEIALKHDPDLPEAMAFLANIRYREGRFEEAERLLMNLLETENVDSSVYRTLGRVQLQLGRKQAGIASLDRALELDPDNEKLRNERDRLLVN